MHLTYTVRNHTERRAHTAEGDLVVARRDAGVRVPLGHGEWLVTAHTADLMGTAQGIVLNNDAGFRGRQWESGIDGQQHPTLRSAMESAITVARYDAAMTRRIRQAREEN